MDQKPAIPQDAIAQEIWDMKYRLKAADGTPIERTVDETAGGAWPGPSPWPRPPHSAKTGPGPFYDAMSGFRFLPAGRILAGAGTGPLGHAVQLLRHGNASRIRWPGSSTALKEAALTMQQGGGIGHDFSTLRPKGAPVQRRGGRCLGSAELHGCVGCHVPHHHVGRRPARRDDGHAALRPSRHRGLHRRQARGAAACAISISRSWSPMPSCRR